MKAEIIACSAVMSVLLGSCAATRTTEFDNAKAELSHAEYVKLAVKAVRSMELTADSPRVVVEYVDSPARRVTVSARRIVMSDVSDSATDVEAVATGQTSINKQTRTSGTRLSDHTSVWLCLALGLLLVLAVRHRG